LHVKEVGVALTDLAAKQNVEKRQHSGNEYHQERFEQESILLRSRQNWDGAAAAIAVV
jgi:hypothetical protein